MIQQLLNRPSTFLRISGGATFVGEGAPGFFLEGGCEERCAGHDEKKVGEAVDISENVGGERVSFMESPQATLGTARRNPALVQES